MKIASILAVSFACVSVAGCGGDSPASQTGLESAPPPLGAQSNDTRGSVVSSTTTMQLQGSDIDTLVAEDPSQTSKLRAMCGVDIKTVTYNTLDPQGNATTAAEAVMVPTGSSQRCFGQRPVLLYAHGTTVQKSYSMADVTKNHEALLVLASFAAQGYIVVAPNYLGYSGSKLNYHPYMNAKASSTDMVDGLRAGLAQTNTAGGSTPSKQLFVSGYSEGGYVAMATAKALQTDYSNEFNITAAVTMSGPYDLVAFGDAVVGGKVNVGATLFMPLLLTSYQNAYGNVYETPADAYQAQFEKTAPTLFPTDVKISDLVAEGELPANDPTFSNLWESGGLLLPTFRASYSASGLRADMQANDLLGWTPKAPLAMCGGSDDPTVFFLNAQNAEKDFASRGTQVPLWNLENPLSLPVGASSDEVYATFQASKLASGSNVDKEYHAILVPPACFTLTRGFFANYLTPQAE